MWVLQLNMMRNRTESRTAVAFSESKEKLEAFVAGERVEPYGDEGFSDFGGHGTTFQKVFRKGGPLEWFNPPESLFGDDAFVDIGTEDDWAGRARERFHAFVSELTRV